MPFIVIAYFAHVIENVLIAIVIKEMGPFLCLTVFYTIATLFVFLYEKALNQKKKSPKTQWKDVLAHKGALSFYVGGAFLGNSLWFCSIYLIGIGSVSFVLIFIRLFVAFYAYLFMNDRYPIDKIATFFIAFIALIFFSYNGLEENWLGITLALISCLAFSAESIAKKKLALSELKPESMVLWRYGILAVAFNMALASAIAFNLIPETMVQIPSMANLALICIACFMGAIATNICLFYGLRTVPLSILEALNTTKPVLFAIIGVMMLNETISDAQLFWGLIIVISSLYFVQTKIGLKK